MEPINDAEPEKLNKLESQVVEEEKSLNFFDKYLSVWVALYIMLGQELVISSPEQHIV